MKTDFTRGFEPLPVKNISQAAQQARRAPSPLEFRFQKEAKARWPSVSWRRYAPVSVTVHPELGPSVWYAPLLCLKQKLVVVLDDPVAFPYRISGRNRDLYARHGYTVLDFSEDFSCEADESAWEQAMGMIDTALHQRQAA